MRATSTKPFRTLGPAALLLLATGCSAPPATIAPETAVPCRDLVIVRPTRAEIAQLSDRTAGDVDANNTAIASGCGRSYP